MAELRTPVMDRLGAILDRGQAPVPLRRRFGVVVAPASAAAATVDLGGGLTIPGVRSIGPFPEVGEVVVVDFNGSDPMIVGILGGTGVGGLSPPGALVCFAGAAIPAGWLNCDGQSVAVATYPRLFAAIGYQYGGSGANFNVPNLKGRVPVGRDAADTDWDTLGETRGAKTHTLTVPETPSHNHGTVGAQTSGPNLQPSTDRFGDWTAGGAQSGWAITGVSGGSNSFNAHSHTLVAAGGGTAHNNLQPSIVLNYVIKT